MSLIDDFQKETNQLVLLEGKTLADVLSKCLDETIREHRDKFSMHVVTDKILTPCRR
jgi:hypothetical protein